MYRISINMLSLFFLIGVIFKAQAYVSADNIVATPVISTDGSFNVAWTYENGPDTSCKWFEISVFKIGVQNGIESEYTSDCTQTTFNASGYVVVQ